jgi:diguanylate cyclase (GGDEF)-like protein/PAS domain S-box-containing protein
MNVDPGHTLNLSAMAAAYAADLILSVLLIFLWLMQRKEKHALLWGVGQFSIMSGSVIWFLTTNILSESTRAIWLALLVTFGMLAYWSGTQFFLGTLRRSHLRPIIITGILSTGLLYVIWFANISAAPAASVSSVGVVMIWMGWQLGRAQNRYRLLCLTLILRGAFNLLSAVTLTPDQYLVWFIGSAILKALSMLGLIYAVQDEIQQRYVRTIDSLSHGFLIRDRAGIVHVANERCARLLGFHKPSELIGRHVSELLPGLTPEMADAYFQRFDAQGVQYPITETATFTLHNGNNLPVELLGSPYIERGQLYCLVQLLDISERKKKDDLLYQAARVDPVTGFYNRYALTSRLTQEVAAAKAAGRECAVLFIDLDKFKRVNDSFGHAVGDELLRDTALRLHSLLLPQDILARFGGDEFIIVLSDLAAGDGARMAGDCAEQVIAAMTNSFHLSHHAVGISASVGIACYPLHGADSDTLIRNADIAMYEAKKSGRSELRFFNDAMNAVAKDALVIDGALRGAIEAGEFYLVYQAITNAHTGQLSKVEALLRWNSALLGPVTPDRFIPVAEDSGMIVELGTWVLNQACRQVAQWQSSVLGNVTISINVSAWQLADPAFVGLVEHALHSNGLQAHQLELELTERVLIDDGADVHTVLRQLKALGVSISLDDFGTGYSSLSYLTQFQLNTLKIDRAFVMDIEHSERSHNLVHAIIAMGHSLGLQLVAEGVETAGQAAILEKMGCHYLQGYHISRPIPPAELLRFADALPAEQQPEGETVVI